MNVSPESPQPEFLDRFLADAEELLQECTQRLSELDNTPRSLPVVNDLFRSLHSLKGNASLLGFSHIKQLAHILESLLSCLRQSPERYCEYWRRLLGQGIDLLIAFLLQLRNGTPGVDPVQQQAVADLRETIERETSDFRVRNQDRLWEQVLAQTMELSQKANQEDDTLRESVNSLTDTLEMIFEDLRRRHIVSRELSLSGGIGRSPLEWIRSILNRDMEEPLPPEQTAEVLNALEECVFWIQDDSQPILQDTLLTVRRILPVDGFSPFLAEVVLTNLEKMQPKQEGGRVRASEDPVRSPVRRSVRVPETAIDALLEQVAELVTVCEAYTHLPERFGEHPVPQDAISQLKKNSLVLMNITEALQRSVLKMRQLPIRSLLRKAMKAARDISGEQGKELTVTLRGEEVLVDKSVLEKLETVCVQIMRNAVVHGIETPAERERAHKQRGGEITVRAYEDNDSLFLEISDDGRGVDIRRLTERAVQCGAVTAAEAAELSPAQAYDLLFVPGVSTASGVTETAGRGVGMDIARQEVESLKGTIQLESTPGSGTMFLIKTPKNILSRSVEALLVRSGTNVFAIPIATVRRSFAVRHADIVLEPDGAEVYPDTRQSYSVQRLDRLFPASNRPGRDHAPGVQIGIVLAAARMHGLLLADEAMGIQQVVVTPLEGIFPGTDCVNGGALLRDGSIATVLDVERLLRAIRGRS